MENSPSRIISLEELCKIPVLTPGVAEGMQEACVVCFEDQGHSSGVLLTIKGDYDSICEILWANSTTELMKRCWADQDETTEQAAYGVAFLIIANFTNFTSIERSVKGTGFDYWLGNQTESELNIFLHRARLEASGIRRGTLTEVNKRVKQKIKQTNPSDHSGLPAFAAVVEFGTPLTKVVKKR